MHGAEAVGAGVAATQDDDVAIGGVNDRRRLVAHRTVGRFEIRHRRVHAGELRSRHRDQSRPRRTEREDDGVEVALEVRERRVGLAHVARSV